MKDVISIACIIAPVNEINGDGDERLVLEMEGKTIFSRCLKQFDGLT